MRLPLPVATKRRSSDPTSTQHRPHERRHTLNVAHRGASQEMPENTLGAIRRAVEVGADMVEIDVHRSKDGVVVLMHDTTLTRTTNAQQVFPGRGPWRVGDFTLDELKRLDAGSWKSPDQAGEPVPTLAEALEVVSRSRTGLLLELKAPEQYPGIVSDVVMTLREAPGSLEAAEAGQLVVQSFNYAAMKEHKTREPSVPVGLLGMPARANLPALGTWADQVNPSHLSVDRAYVDQVHDLGMACFVWTVNHAPGMRRALRLGVDGVITNRPRSFGRVRAGRAQP